MKYIPSPIDIQYSFAFSALVNKSGRMQYYKSDSAKPENKLRISRTQFIEVFNTYKIISIKPIQEKNAAVFQMEFYI
jgi:hypothetical protein